MSVKQETQDMLHTVLLTFLKLICKYNQIERL